MRCAFYCSAESYDMDLLAKFFNSMEMDPKLYGEAIHIQNEESDIIHFSYGCSVFWNLREEEELRLLSDLKPYSKSPLKEYKSDICLFEYSDETAIDEEEDRVILEDANPLIKISLSYGLSQSVKLQVFEDEVLKTIEKTKHLTNDLSAQGKTTLSRKQISQYIGELFAQRNSINLHSDILDTPEFFWRRPKYETYYQAASMYMDIKKRLDILNKRLEVIHDLYNILLDELKHSHSSRLEWIVILLILSEVFLSLFHFLPK